MNSASTQKAKALRKGATEAEKLIWKHLRAKQLHGVKFRRQQPIGKYIVDFVCFSHKLIIELDGGQHGQPQEMLKDQQRTLWLQEQGFKVLRFWNSDVFQNLEGVLTTIYVELFGVPFSPSPSPSHQGRGEDAPTRKDNSPVPNPSHQGRGDDAAPGEGNQSSPPLVEGVRGGGYIKR